TRKPCSAPISTRGSGTSATTTFATARTSTWVTTWRSPSWADKQRRRGIHDRGHGRPASGGVLLLRGPPPQVRPHVREMAAFARCEQARSAPESLYGPVADGGRDALPGRHTAHAHSRAASEHRAG